MTKLLITGRGLLGQTIITGGVGFIGCNFVRHILEEHS